MRTLILLLALPLIALSGCTTLDSLNPFADKPKSKLGKLPALPVGGDLKATWRQSVGSHGLYSFVPLVTDNAIFVAAFDGTVTRIDGNTVTWRIGLKEALSSGVGSDGKRVAVGTPKGDIVVLDAKDGKELWRTKTTSELLAPPTVAEGLVIVRSGDSRILAYDAADGKRRWTYQRTMPSLTLRSSAGVVVKGDRTFAGFPGGKLVALSNQNGAAVWESTVALPRGATELERVTDVTSDPAISGSVICAVAFQGKLTCFDVNTGNGLWSRDISSSSGADMDNLAVYVADDKGVVHALALPTGGVVWKQDLLSGRTLGRPVIMGDRIAVADDAGYLHVLNKADGSIAARAATDGLVMAQGISRGKAGLVTLARNGSLSIYGELKAP